MQAITAVAADATFRCLSRIIGNSANLRMQGARASVSYNTKLLALLFKRSRGQLDFLHSCPSWGGVH
jgi:hypothetical protein